MHKPVEIIYGGKSTWTVGRQGIVEYLVWSFNGYATSSALLSELESRFKVVLSVGALSNLTRALIKEGRLVSPKRGVFIHVEHAGMFG